MENLDQLISCSGDLNHHLVAFAQGDDFREVLSQALEDRFGEVITGDEAEIANFFDYFNMSCTMVARCWAIIW